MTAGDKYRTSECRFGGDLRLIAWHLISVVLAAWTACYALILLPEPDFTGADKETARACRIRMSMRILYLSSWNYVAYGLFAILSVIQDIWPHRKLRWFLDWLFTTYVLPFSLTVSMVFWAAQSVSSTLLVPPPLAPLLTPLLNHVVHSTVAFGVVFELLIRPVKFPNGAARKLAAARRHKLLLAWQIMSHVMYAFTGVFMYPINGIFGWPLCYLLDLSLHSVLLAADFIPRTVALWWWSGTRSAILKNLPLESAATVCRQIVFNKTAHRSTFGL